MKSATVHFTLTVAAPLHIGCGEVYEPMGFVIDPDTCELTSFAPADFLANLSSDELDKFSAICARGTVDSIQDLYKFMRQHREFADGTRVGVSRAFVEHYTNVLEKPKNRFCSEMNQFEVARTAFNPLDNQPVIPGSSIKGAIRTAVLNAREKETPQPKKDYRNIQAKYVAKETANESSRVQKNLLGGTFATDPFRLVKVSDFMPVGEVKRKIVYAVDVKKKLSDKEPAALHQILEVVEPGAVFIGSITVLSAPREIIKPISVDDIVTALAGFYGSEMKREGRDLAGINVQPVKIETEENIMPLRIGRHSGAECVTVNGHRHIRIMQGPGNPPKFGKSATTIWLTSERSKATTMQGLQPMGWVSLSRLNKDQLAEINSQRDAALAEQRQRRRQELEAQARREAEMLEQARQAEALRLEQEKQDEAEETRKAAAKQQWQEMSELERDLACIRREEVALRFAASDANDPIKTIWKKIDSVPPDIQKAMALAFKERFIADNKWKIKKKKNKQWEKVQKVKGILEE